MARKTQQEQDTTIRVNLTYPRNDKYDYRTYLNRLNLDETRVEDIRSGKGFIITEPKGIKKDLKTSNGIFSSLYGSNSMSDVDSFNGRYRCQCGMKRGSINHGELCEECGTRVKFVDEDVSKVGYLVLHDQYYIIHPNIYRTLEAFIGASKLERIIYAKIDVDQDGNYLPIQPTKKDEPFAKIGILEFHDRFEEIINFYYAKKKDKTYYDDIMNLYREGKVFTHTIPVYSSLLRPSKVDNGSLRYEDCNAEFQNLAALVYNCNNDKYRINRKLKDKLEVLYEIQMNFNTIYTKIKEILAKKKGDIRSAIGGRYSFTSRCVIKQDVDLRADEIKLPFHALCELLQQVIINVLVKSNSMTYAEAYKKWYRAQVTGNDQIIYGIIDGLIKDSPYGGLPVIINRNPTISYGGILMTKCIGINMDYTMSISLLVLPGLAADFDGDTLNIMYLYNKDFLTRSINVLSPKNMFISRNDGRCNKDMIHSRDIIINANSMKFLYTYTQEEIDQIKRLQSMQ